jgi:predicted transcriptional regulator
MPVAASERTSAGSDLRAERTRLGISRAQLAGLADCSMAALGNIENGAVPKRSSVLERAFAALAALSADRAGDGA